jgi:hypothetical protein
VVICEITRAMWGFLKDEAGKNRQRCDRTSRHTVTTDHRLLQRPCYGVLQVALEKEDYLKAIGGVQHAHAAPSRFMCGTAQNM